jgi:hypothetical protein
VTALDVNGLSLSTMPALTNLGGLSGLRTCRRLFLDSLPLVTSLQALRGTTFRDGIFIRRMANLTTLRDLTGIDSVFQGGVGLLENPLLTDLSVLSRLTSVGGIQIASDVITDLSFLSALQLSAGSLTFSGAALSSVTLPNLLHSGPITVPLESPSLTTVSFPLLQDAGAGGSIGVLVSGVGCGSGRVSVLLPSLRTAGALNVGTGEFVVPGCSITVDAPGLTTATFGVFFTGGVTAFTLREPLTAQQVAIAFSSVTRINLPNIDTQILTIRLNQQLTTLGTGSGRVTDRIIIMFNLNLSQAEAGQWVNNFSPHGMLFISGNKTP